MQQIADFFLNDRTTNLRREHDSKLHPNLLGKKDIIKKSDKDNLNEDSSVSFQLSGEDEDDIEDEQAKANDDSPGKSKMYKLL